MKTAAVERTSGAAEAIWLLELICVLLALLLFAISLRVEIQYVYFPGWSIEQPTALMDAEKSLANIFIWIGRALSIWFVALAAMASRFSINKALVGSVIFYVLIVVAFVAVDRQLVAHLAAGVG